MKKGFYGLFVAAMFFGKMGQSQTITITSTIPNPLLPGASFSIDFSITGTYNTKNVFTAQLSDSTGNFAVPTGIGNLKSNKGGTIPALIPSTTIPSAGYKIRIYASMPAIISPTVGSPIGSTGAKPFSRILLDSLENVKISSPTSGQVLSYDGTYWVNSSSSGGGGGTVSSVSIDSANGFKGTVTNATSTPAINIKTNVTGLLKGNASTGAVSAATAGTDYLVPNASITGATKTKITYDANGLVTAGANAVVADISGLQDSLNVKLAKNASITGATKTKITYDANGLVTAGANAAVADISGLQDSLNAKFATSTALAYIAAIQDSLDKKLSATITSPANGQILSYDGSKWVNSTPSGGGTVSSVSVDSANGFKGTVTNATSTPVINIKTTVTGLIKGNSATGAVSAATAGTDYLVPNASITGATKTKITYDANGLVTAGANAVVADISGLQDSLNVKLAKNASITGATKTKITYDANGLVTAGANATVADVSGLQDSLDKKLSATLTSPANGQILSYDGTKWVNSTPSGGGGGWSLTGNSGLNAATNFIGTIDDVPVVFKMKGQPSGIIDSASENTAMGYLTLANNSGLYNTAFGWSTLRSNTTGSSNTALGDAALYANTIGIDNTAIGTVALASNTTGVENTAMGRTALYENTTGNNNTAIGAYSLSYNTTGSNNSALGEVALLSNTTGSENTAIGTASLYANTTGNHNTGIGRSALAYNTTGYENTATGTYSLYSNTSGFRNSATGYNSLFFNSTGYNNTAVGHSSLYANAGGTDNTALGYYSLLLNTSGYGNTAAGSESLNSNTTGYYNTANGFSALSKNTIGNNNTASGAGSLYNNTTGKNNTSTGLSSLYFNTTGKDNTSAGFNALAQNTTGSYNTAFGDSSLYNNTTGSYNTALGYFANVSASGLNNTTAIGNGASVDASNKVRIGNASVSVIEGQVQWSIASDGRYKKNVKEDAPGLNLIMKLRPVTYNFEYAKFSEQLKEKNADKAHLQQRESKKEMGFVAQEVENALKDLGTEVSNLVNVPQSSDGHYSLAYAELVVPLVKAVQEQQKLIQDQQKANEQQQKTNEQQQKTIDDLKKMIEALQKQSASNGLTTTQTSGSAAAMETQASGILLGQNIPNPFDGKTIIPFRIPAEFQEASIVISNLTTGQVLKAYMVTSRDTQLSVDMSSAAAGTYAYTLYVNGKATATKKLVVGR